MMLEQKLLKDWYHGLSVTIGDGEDLMIYMQGLLPTVSPPLTLNFSSLREMINSCPTRQDSVDRDNSPSFPLLSFLDCIHIVGFFLGLGGDQAILITVTLAIVLNDLPSTL